MVEFNLEQEPQQGLGPQNQQWRRWVLNSLTQLARGFRNFRNDITNSFRAIDSSMRSLSQLTTYVWGFDGAISLDSVPGPKALSASVPAVLGSITNEYVGTGKVLVTVSGRLTATLISGLASNFVSSALSVRVRDADGGIVFQPDVDGGNPGPPVFTYADLGIAQARALNNLNPGQSLIDVAVSSGVQLFELPDAGFYTFDLIHYSNSILGAGSTGQWMVLNPGLTVQVIK